jgi:phosphorylase kinase alpha/beta subunit
LLPELYILPKFSIKLEKENPHSQERYPNENVPLVWAQSLYILGELIMDDLLSPAEIDPLGRHLKFKRNPSAVQLVYISEDREVQAEFASFGIASQTQEEIYPITIASPTTLSKVYSYLGANEKLSLTGRPNRPVGPLSTCCMYKIRGHVFFFTPNCMNHEEFYVNMDNEYLISVLEQELSFVSRHWFNPGRPTMIITLKKEMLQTKFIHFLISLNSGDLKGVKVKLGRIQEMTITSFSVSLEFVVDKCPEWEKLLVMHTKRHDHLRTPLSENTSPISPFFNSNNFNNIMHATSHQGKPYEKAELVLKESANIYEQMDALHTLVIQKGMSYNVEECHATVKELLQEVYENSAKLLLWSLVRHAAGLLKKVVNSLTVNLTNILISQKQVSIGVEDEMFIDSPKTPDEIATVIYQQSASDPRMCCLVQETLTYLGNFIIQDHSLFQGILNVRIHFIIFAMRDEIGRIKDVDEATAQEHLYQLSPFQLKQHLKFMLGFKTENDDESLSQYRHLPSKGRWLRNRKINGALQRKPVDFYPKIYSILEICDGIKINDTTIPSFPTINEKTPEEINFAVLVESLINTVVEPAERQVIVECLMVIYEISKRNNLKLISTIIDVGCILRKAYDIFDLGQRPKIDKTLHFWDLDQQGENGTFFYIGKAVMTILPFSLAETNCNQQ